MLDAVAAGGLLVAGRPVIVLLSGGRDSACLLDLAVRIAGPEAVAALHVNYGLREAADADERHCARAVRAARGAAAGLAARGGRSAATSRRGPATSATARPRGWRCARTADVAAGHTATDQVETILYRLASSPSRRALLGMRPREGALVRPLLGSRASRPRPTAPPWSELARGREQRRGRLRPQPDPGRAPAGAARCPPGRHANVLALADVLRDEGAVLDGLVDKSSAGRGEIELARLRELPPALARLVVQRLADDAAGGHRARGRPPARRRDRATRPRHGRARRRRRRAGGSRVRAWCASSASTRRRARSRRPPRAVRLPIPGAVRFGCQRGQLRARPPTREPGVLDRATLGDELVVRAWRPGDRMAPLGLGAKQEPAGPVHRPARPATRGAARSPVVESGGEIAWVAGVATSERFKVTESTREARGRLARLREPARREATR